MLQDNVFVTVVASVQYRALAEKASDAFYRLSNTRGQIQSYVFDGNSAQFDDLSNIVLHPVFKLEIFFVPNLLIR